jgi:nitrite reductase/ring-hydroxylating ferredoxin subunit/alkylhydroperoxidase/carboxymuconolactone decarboxylase family protein YurZ
VSDALDYLLKARPDAIGHYFRFLKQAGSTLEPKTRALISVITKVHSQTERGFRQYLVRALNEGVKPAEVLDALLMAFPALGMAKIVWAVDLILEMDIPEFRPELMGAAPKWHDVAAAEAIGKGEVKRIACDGRELFVCRPDGEWRVYDSRCPHQVTNIPLVALSGLQLTCPKHGWKFDIASGQCIEKGSRPLKRFDTRVEGGRLQAYW